MKIFSLLILISISTGIFLYKKNTPVNKYDLQEELNHNIPQEIILQLNSLSPDPYAKEFIIKELTVLSLYLYVQDVKDFTHLSAYSRMVQSCSRDLLKKQDPKNYPNNFSKFMQEQRRLKRSIRENPKYKQLVQHLNQTTQKYQGASLDFYNIPCDQYNKIFTLPSTQ